ncbi:MAG: molybdopterin molybdotransferase MoeA [Armatimonadetes bacterium]|nr:molybdopterin molybdotransferase MoeA [Armatimonadota bacterium]MDE2207417.1 molybdopterin molybdotransferase MoeA [Armatimonadota bacterium]
MRRVEETRAAILDGISPLEVEYLPSEAAVGRRLATPLLAVQPIPAFDSSAVDGYAVIAGDVAAASAHSPASLRLTGSSVAGGGPPPPVTTGRCVRILTGAPVPTGADAIVMQEDVQVTAEGIMLHAEVRCGAYIRPAGAECAAGAEVLPAGFRITAAAAPLLLTAAPGGALFARRPRVAVLTTGDEVLDAGAFGEAPFGAVVNTNRLMLKALISDAGAECCETAHAADSLEDTLRHLARFAKQPEPADVIIAAGGVSVGDRDFVKPAVEQLGTLDLWRVAVKPGKPFAFGRIDKTLFFGLPGNPASAFVTFVLFVLPALRKLAGARHPEADRWVTAVATKDLQCDPVRDEYLRAAVEFGEDGAVLRTAVGQGSGMLISLARANALALLPAGGGAIRAGERVKAMLLQPVDA